MSGQLLAKDDYIFNQSQSAATRLNYQHWIHYQVLNWRLHPSIPRGPGLRIADVGAGSGIWAQELAGELPDATIDAFDIVMDQFPSQAWMPARLRFIKQDCLEPFPPEYEGRYDIVNVRFFLVILVPSNVSKFIRNLTKLLRPGGYLQWYEPDMETMVARSSPPAPTPAIDRLIPIAQKPTPDSDHGWVKNLDKMLPDYGFKMISFDHYELPDVLLPVFTQAQLMGYEALGDGLERGGHAEAAKQTRQHLVQLRQEYSRGGAIKFDFRCAIAQL